MYYDAAIIDYQENKGGCKNWLTKVQENGKYVVRIIDAARYLYSVDTGEYVAGTNAVFTYDENATPKSKWTTK